MAKFKLIVSDPSNGLSTVTEVEGAKAQVFADRSIGETVDGSILGLGSDKLLITGGCDKNGIPMRPDVNGPGKRYVLLSAGPGFKPRERGERRRKLVRGRVISDEIFQINLRLQKPEKQKSKAATKETGGLAERVETKS